MSGLKILENNEKIYLNCEKIKWCGLIWMTSPYLIIQFVFYIIQFNYLDMPNTIFIQCNKRDVLYINYDLFLKNISPSLLFLSLSSLKNKLFDQIRVACFIIFSKTRVDNFQNTRQNFPFRLLHMRLGL